MVAVHSFRSFCSQPLPCFWDGLTQSTEAGRVYHLIIARKEKEKESEKR
jgi:hypothetical protein